MNITRLPFRCLLALCGVAFVSAPFAGAAPSYSLLKEIPIGGEGGWDYLSIDPAAHALYVTHATKIEVVDLATDHVAGQITDLSGVHGFAIAHDLGRGFASNGRGNNVSIVDLATLKTLSKVDTGENPDAILYEPSRKEVYAFNGHGNSATVFEAATGKVIATVPLPGKPEFATCDPKAGRVYCNIEDKSEVSVIDIAKHEVVAHWPIAPGESASGMAIDLKHHRLFLGCDNKLMVMMDSTNGKVLGSVPIGPRVDANGFDPETNLAFSSNGDGTLTIAQETAAGKLEVVQTVKTARGARTMAVDPGTHNIYLSSAEFGTEPSPAPGDTGHHRPPIVPNTFKILVVGPAAAAKP